VAPFLSSFQPVTGEVLIAEVYVRDLSQFQSFHSTESIIHVFQLYITSASALTDESAMTSHRQRAMGKRRTSYESVLISHSQVPTTNHFLLRWYELPAWLQESNEFILDHYRPPSYSYTRSFQSLFYMHNESVNIHTHLLGSFLFSFISVTVYAIESHSVSAADICVFGCFFLGVVICLAMSAIFHTISNHSPGVAQFGNQLDYIGIVFLITGSFIPSVYYGFYCDPSLQHLYWGMVSQLALSSI
jgi:adiponectin receptor